MANPVLLALFIVGVLLILAFYIISKTLYKVRHKETYSFWRMFPYELNYPYVFKENPWGNLLFIFASLVVVAFYVMNPYGDIYRIIGIIISIVFTMVSICLLLMPMNYLRTHLFLSVLAMTLSLALPLFNIFLAYSDYVFYTNITSRVLSIVSMVISGLLAITLVLLIFNPKLTFKIYLDKEIDSDGNEVLKRPKVIFLALNEWMTIFIYFLTPLAVVLVNIVN